MDNTGRYLSKLIADRSGGVGEEKHFFSKTKMLSDINSDHMTRHVISCRSTSLFWLNTCDIWPRNTKRTCTGNWWQFPPSTDGSGSHSSCRAAGNSSSPFWIPFPTSSVVCIPGSASLWWRGSSSVCSSRVTFPDKLGQCLRLGTNPGRWRRSIHPVCPPGNWRGLPSCNAVLDSCRFAGNLPVGANTSLSYSCQILRDIYTSSSLFYEPTAK